VSNPTLANIEKRWESMPPQEQADLWMQLRDRMKAPWHEMTVQEKKAGGFYRAAPGKFVNGMANLTQCSVLDRVRTSRAACPSASR
jgi:hypothetical protein